MRILPENCGPSFIQQPDAPEVHNCSGGAGISFLEILELIESDSAMNSAELSLASQRRTMLCGWLVERIANWESQALICSDNEKCGRSVIVMSLMVIASFEH